MYYVYSCVQHSLYKSSEANSVDIKLSLRIIKRNINEFDIIKIKIEQVIFHSELRGNNSATITTCIH